MRLWFQLWSQTTSLGYLAAVLQGQVKDDSDLSALDANVIVMQTLDVARSSAARAAQLPCSRLTLIGGRSIDATTRLVGAAF